MNIPKILKMLKLNGFGKRPQGFLGKSKYAWFGGFLKSF
jgi:hypothetical protein